jgi:hypothetical protein
LALGGHFAFIASLAFKAQSPEPRA